jgi:hypothetical protein
MPDKTKNIITVACTVIGTFIAIGSILYACGSVVGEINDNKDDISTLQQNDSRQDTDIVNLRIGAEKQQSTADSTLSVLTGIHEEMKAIRTEQTTMKSVQAVNSEKLKQLTKD